jgi:hypothetical protein
MDYNPVNNPEQVITLNTTLTAYKIPLSAIALWPAPNLVNPERRHWLIPFAFCLEVLTTLTLTARLWTRVTRQAGAFGGDDALIIAAWVFGSIFTALTIFGLSLTQVLRQKSNAF